jgi:hypothetical protein
MADACRAVVNETVCVQADVTVTPVVTVGNVRSFCVGGLVIGACAGTPVEACTFTVSQSICVQVPLTFAADVVAVPTGVVCGTPAPGPCTTAATGDPCTDCS